MNTQQAFQHLIRAANHARLAGESLVPPETRKQLALLKYELRSALADLIDPGQPPTDSPSEQPEPPTQGPRRINIEEG